MKKSLLLILFSISITYTLFATHNYAGEIVYRQLSATEVEASVYTYTIASSIAPDRDSLHICWGDGNCDRISRSNGPGNNGELISDHIKMNIYRAVHTYQSLGTYEISMSDPNRNGGISNVDFPNSENTVFKLAAKIKLMDMVDEPLVQAPALLNPPIDLAIEGIPFYHTPNAFSLQGDSIRYELITPLEVLDYQMPTEIEPGDNNTLSMNGATGLLVWDSPQMIGFYVITYRITFYRDGTEIGWIIRDMMIEVEEDDNLVPEIIISNIENNSEVIEVEVGDTVMFDITVEDDNSNQQLEITANSGLFEMNNPAMFVASASGSSGTATFEWIVQEEHLREYPYQLVVRAMDDDPEHPLSSLAVVRFRTLGFTTGLFDPLVSQSFEVYPNPVQDGMLSFSIEQDDMPKTYSIFNTMGQELDRGLLSPYDQELAVKDLPKGLYYLSLRGENTRWTGSFLIQ